ncbi:CRE-INX-10 protein [Caenorhabditis remanei]|uniref:Innexin n=1 Tax=Caenorhabditis remanei TaxID=31234 RepID=E3N574_CAERE|nr:CRE-INX-10 protein [Caenorhabditis remanei]
MVLAAVLSMLRYVAGSDDRDFVDRLHSYFTCNLLIGLSVLVSFKQFGGKPVECLVPDIFSSSWEQYAENYCWASDTYYVPTNEPVAGLHIDEKRQRKISYYQWVPFFLLLEAACFRLPSLLWKYLAGHSGIKINEIVKLSSDPNNIKPDIKRANIKSLTVHLQGALRFHRRLQKKQIRPHRFLWLFNLPYSAFFVTSMYLCTKFFYLANVCLQLLFMNRFLETDKYKWYGLGALVDLLNGTTWEQSGMFPRVSLCDFDVRVMGNMQEHTIQCVLVINIFNEKIFILLWFWYLALLIFTFGSFFYWLIVSLWGHLNQRFIIRHLEMSDIQFDSSEDGAPEKVTRFIDNYLKSDGVFVIRMMTLQSGVIFGTDLVQELWRNFHGTEPQLKRSNSAPRIEEREQWWPAPPLVNSINPWRYRDENQANALRWRRALGANVDNTIATQDLMEKLLPQNAHLRPSDDELLRRYPIAVKASYIDDDQESQKTSAEQKSQNSGQPLQQPPSNQYSTYYRSPSFSKPPDSRPVSTATENNDPAKKPPMSTFK